MYWLLVGLVRSLTSSHKEALKTPLLIEDYNDLTSPTSNQIPDIHIAASVIYDTLKIIFRASMFILFNTSFQLRCNWVYIFKTHWCKWETD